MKNSGFIVMILLFGSGILGYGFWALTSGKIISTGGHMLYKPNALYWITVACFILLGGANVVVGFYLLIKHILG
jgi:hypothetical protein